MSHLSIKDVPEAWAEALRQRAARNHRSLQGELMAILERALAEGPAQAGHSVPGFVSGGAANPGQAQTRHAPAPAPSLSGLSRPANQAIEQVAAELRARFPQGLPTGPSSIDLIRQQRDAR